MTDRTLREKIEALTSYDQCLKRPLAMVEASDGDGNWICRRTVLALLDAHTAEQPAPAQRCAECDCKHGGRCCTWIKSDGPCEQCHPQPAPDAVAEARQLIAQHDALIADSKYGSANTLRKCEMLSLVRNIAKGSRL